jgi:hypothetical protein
LKLVLGQTLNFPCSHCSQLTIFTPRSTEVEGFDRILLASIFRSQHWTPLQQLSLTLVWDRVDIATNEVFVYGRDWSRGELTNIHTLTLTIGIAMEIF